MQYTLPFLCVMLCIVLIAATELGVWLFRDLHGVSETVSDLTRSALLYTCAYPLFEALVSISLYSIL